MLARPAGAGAAAVVVGPDDLVHESFAAEEAIQHNLDVVHLAVVEVDHERAIGREAAEGGVDPRRYRKSR